MIFLWLTLVVVFVWFLAEWRDARRIARMPLFDEYLRRRGVTHPDSSRGWLLFQDGRVLPHGTSGGGPR